MRCVPLIHNINAKINDGLWVIINKYQVTNKVIANESSTRMQIIAVFAWNQSTNGDIYIFISHHSAKSWCDISLHPVLNAFSISVAFFCCCCFFVLFTPYYWHLFRCFRWISNRNRQSGVHFNMHPWKNGCCVCVCAEIRERTLALSLPIRFHRSKTFEIHSPCSILIFSAGIKILSTDITLESIALDVVGIFSSYLCLMAVGVVLCGTALFKVLCLTLFK